MRIILVLIAPNNETNRRRKPGTPLPCARRTDSAQLKRSDTLMGIFNRRRTTPLQQKLEALMGGDMQPFDNKLVRKMTTEQLLQYLPAAKRGMGVYLMWSSEHAEPGDAMPTKLEGWMRKAGVELFVIEHRLTSCDEDVDTAHQIEVRRLIDVLAALRDQTSDELSATLRGDVRRTLAAIGYGFEGGY